MFKKNEFKKILLFWSLFLMSFNINQVSANDVIDLCTDNWLNRIVHNNLPLTNPSYQPSWMISLTSNQYMKINWTVQVRKELQEPLLKLATLYKNEFNKELNIYGGYNTPANLDTRKTNTWWKIILYQGRWMSDSQLWLSVFLVSPTNNVPIKELDFLIKNWATLWFYKIYDGTNNFPNINNYFRFMGAEMQKILSSNSSTSPIDFITKEIAKNPKFSTCYKEYKGTIETTIPTDTWTTENPTTWTSTTPTEWWTTTTTPAVSAWIEWATWSPQNITTLKSGWFWVDGSFPWTFQGSYRDLWNDIIKQLRMNITISSSFSSLEKNALLQNNSFTALYADALAYAASGKNIWDPARKDEIVKILQQPVVRDFFYKLAPAVSLRENGWNIKINSRHNYQGVFQHYVIQWYADWVTSCWKWWIYYTACDRNIIKSIYQPSKNLTRDDLMIQTINIWIFWANKFGSFDKNFLNASSPYSYAQNLDIIFGAIQDELWLTPEEKQTLIAWIISQNSWSISTIYSKKANIFQRYWLNNVNDLLMFKDLIYSAWYFTAYNGAWNNGNWMRVQKWKVKFTFDHAYVSNSPKQWVCFYQCAVDGCARLNINVNNGAAHSYFQTIYQPSDAERYTLAYTTLLQRFKQKWLLKAIAPKCNNK